MSAALRRCRKQAEIGIDIPSDGEFSKPTFSSYVAERLSGLGPSPPVTTKPYTYPMLQEEFPGFMARVQRHVHEHLDAEVDPKDMVRPQWPRRRRAFRDRPDRLSGTGPVAARHRQLQGRDRSGFR